jgi:hypothetical protein
MFITEPPNFSKIKKHNFNSVMRSTQAESNTQNNSQLTHMMMNMANNKFMNLNRGGHINFNQMNSNMSEYENRRPYNDRQASTLTQVKQINQSFINDSANRTTQRAYHSSLGPIPIKHNLTF